jgi:hypothetical protein
MHGVANTSANTLRETYPGSYGTEHTKRQVQRRVVRVFWCSDKFYSNRKMVQYKWMLINRKQGNVNPAVDTTDLLHALHVSNRMTNMITDFCYNWSWLDMSD